MKHKINLQENYIFLGLLGLTFVIGAYGLVKTPQKTSTSENRSLNQFQHFTLKTFINGSFQDNFEKALSDQFAFSEKIRTTYGQAISNLPTFGLSQICSGRYLELPNSKDTKRATFNCEDYIVAFPYDSTNNAFNENIKKYNHINTVSDIYYYVINNYRNINFEKNIKTIDYVSILSNNLTGNYHLASLQINNYDDYKNFFYKTDHHWNHKGSYQGFTDIAKMLNIKNSAKPTRTFTNHEFFFGSHARNTRNYGILEEFSVYTFDIPTHTTYINGNPKQYGHLNNFLNHNYEYEINKNFYSYVYGEDYGEITFDFHQPNKNNLLIISNSYSNAINEIISQYFNKTYIVDLRYYEKALGQKFAFSKYITENQIDKVLIIGDPNFFLDSELNQGLEL